MENKVKIDLTTLKRLVRKEGLEKFLRRYDPSLKGMILTMLREA